MSQNLGVVIIGRNEGDRLRNCLNCLKTELNQNIPLVYVDSGSIDGSHELAQQYCQTVIELDNQTPYTAARARNAGLFWLIANYPHLNYIQFIDGDCTLATDWISKAIAALELDSKIAVVCGRRREKNPEASVYNLLANLEWNKPIGEAKACGGDALIRVEALKEVNGYNGALICGEEPEMCIRLREQGWKILRIDADMTWHDIAMSKFSQWWKRSVRGGWAIAEGYAMHGAHPERYMVREHLSGWFWGLILPILAVGLSWISHGWSLLLLLAYPLLMAKIYYNYLQKGYIKNEAIVYAFFAVVFKFAQVIGQAQYWLNRWQGKQATLIEYKQGQDQVKIST